MLTHRGNAASLASGARPLPVLWSQGPDHLCGPGALLKNLGRFPDVSGHREGTNLARSAGVSWCTPTRLAMLLGCLLCFLPPLEDDELLEGPAFPSSSTFVQELFQAQYRYDLL